MRAKKFCRLKVEIERALAKWQKRKVFPFYFLDIAFDFKPLQNKKKIFLNRKDNQMSGREWKRTKNKNKPNGGKEECLCNFLYIVKTPIALHPTCYYVVHANE